MSDKNTNIEEDLNLALDNLTTTNTIDLDGDLSNNTIVDNSVYTTSNSYGITHGSTGYIYNNGYNNIYSSTSNIIPDMDDLSIDLIKLSKAEESIQELVNKLIDRLTSNNIDYNSSKLIVNTLEAHGFLADKKTCERKSKIDNLK